MNVTPFVSSENNAEAIEEAAAVLRSYLREKKLDGTIAVSIDTLRPDILKVVERFSVYQYCEFIRKYQIRASAAKKQIGSFLTTLRNLRNGLKTISDEHWRGLAEFASDVYADLVDVKDEISQRNTNLSQSSEVSDDSFAGHIFHEIDIVGADLFTLTATVDRVERCWNADLSTLSTTVDRVERRWNAVHDSLIGGSIADPRSAFHGFIADLAGVWLKYVGREPPAPESYEDKLGKDKGGHFVNFVRPVARVCAINTDECQFGYRVSNALDANKKSKKTTAKLNAVF
jgi:hypothetical protein